MWVRADAATDPCGRGIHACRTHDLPWWLADELWEIELQGQVRVDAHKIVAAAGRLGSRVERWTPMCAQEYADACAWRVRGSTIQGLTDAGYEHAADKLSMCATLDQLLIAARRLVEDLPDARIPLTIAADGAVRALSGAAPPTAYIAAHAALRVGGPAGYAAERAWQSRWLRQRLGLPRSVWRPTR
jgi:hypothetical protein